MLFKNNMLHWVGLLLMAEMFLHRLMLKVTICTLWTRELHHQQRKNNKGATNVYIQIVTVHAAVCSNITFFLETAAVLDEWNHFLYTVKVGSRYFYMVCLKSTCQHSDSVQTLWGRKKTKQNVSRKWREFQNDPTSF